MSETIDLFLYDKDIEKAKTEAITAEMTYGAASRLPGDDAAEEAETQRLAAIEAFQHFIYLERTRYKLLEEWANEKLNTLQGK